VESSRQLSLDSSFLRSVDLVLSGVAVVRTLTSILARAMVKLLASFALDGVDRSALHSVVLPFANRPGNFFLFPMLCGGLNAWSFTVCWE
jgi:hypothetical protein